MELGKDIQTNNIPLMFYKHIRVTENEKVRWFTTELKVMTTLQITPRLTRAIADRLFYFPYFFLIKPIEDRVEIRLESITTIKE